MKKQFKLSGSALYKIEVELSKIIDKNNFVLNKDTKTLMVNFSDEEKSIEQVKDIINCISDIDEDIDIEEKEIKPVIRKVLTLKNLDCGS